MSKEIESLEKKIEKNTSKIKHNEERILRNTGALELLHTINGGSKMFFTMWLITFIAFLGSIGCIIYLLIK